MSNYIEKAKSLEKDIADMEPLDQINYVYNLYNEMAQAAPEEISNLNTFCKAQEHVRVVWGYLVEDYKKTMEKTLEQRVSELPFCTIISTNNNPIIYVGISDKFSAEIIYKWNSSIIVGFVQHITDKYDHKSMVDIVIRWKDIPDWLKNSYKYIHGHFKKEVAIQNWIDVIIDTAVELHNHSIDVVSFCYASSNIDDMGNIVVIHDIWKTKGTLESITKEAPIPHVYHAKKSEQEKWDRFPSFHGSNGTYVENVNMYWSLNLKIKRPSYEVHNPIPYNIDIHNYITQILMPKLGWERITQERLDKLNNIVAGLTIELETHDTDQAALNREFKPVGFKDWNDYLDGLFVSTLEF